MSKLKQVVMLAHTYEEKRVTYPCFVQPKLNGIRAYFRKGNLYSRDRKLLQVATHITTSLQNLKLSNDVILDGELYKHGWTLGRINGAIGVNCKTATEDTSQIGYCVFDIVQEGATFHQRWAYIHKHLIPILPSCVTTVFPLACNNSEVADKFYTHFLDSGFEGIIYRVGACLYRKGMRSSQLLKRKPWKDAWFPVVKLNEGKTTELGSRLVGTLGSVTCLMADGKEFDAGSGFTDSERDYLWHNDMKIKEAHIKYECLSEDGIPLKPTVIEWR